VRLVLSVPAGADVEIEFKILGPPELWTGQESVVMSPRLWSVLAGLLIAPGVPVPVETLIDRVWGEDPPQRANSTIRSYVWRIDRALSQALGDMPQVSRRAHGYALEIDPQAIDLHRFRSLKRMADALADSGEARRAAELLREAAAIWRGQALAGLSGDWILRQRDIMEEEQRAAALRRIELELTMGRHAELLAELGELAEVHRLDEDVIAHRMLALFRTGRQADALRVYREAYARLAEEGIQPNSELTRLHERILRHDTELAITPAYRRGGPQAQPATLPTDISDFTGRAAQVRMLTEQPVPQKQPALWIVEGAAGIGKTALAIHAAHLVAHLYPDAQLYLDFRAHDHHREPLTSSDAIGELLAMLYGSAIGIPANPDARADLWRAELARRRAVLVFDDVVSPEQIRPLVPTAGSSLIIVTSRRRRTGWGAAGTLPLPVLSQEDAAALFVRIAGRVADHEPDQVARASRLCDCLPLAIRLAAGWMRSGGVASMSELIDELAEPAGKHGVQTEVSRGIRSAFELSYRCLGVDEQRFFCFLGVSPCLLVTAHSAARIAGMTVVEARAALTVLAGHHLLEENAQGRFGFHDLIRAFAVGHFVDRGSEHEKREVVRRLADYYLRAVTRASKVRHGHPCEANGGAPPDMPFANTPAEAEAWLESEWVNAIRVAEQCARHEFKRRCADIVHALGEFLGTSGHWEEALAANLTALQACRDLDDLPGAARSALDLGLTSLRTGRSEAALQQATEAANAFGRLDDKLGRAAALDCIGVVHCSAARFRDALAYHREALEISQEAGDRSGTARALGHTGIALWYLGRLKEETSYLNQALDIYREIGDLRGQAITINNIGNAQYYGGYHRDAMLSYQASHDIFREIGGRQNLAIADHNMGRVQQYKGNYSSAIVIYRDVLATYRSMGDLRHQAYALADIGAVCMSTESFDEALAHYENAACAAMKASDSYEYAEAVRGIAEAHSRSGRLEVALENYEKVARLAGEIESLYLRAKALTGIAEIVLHTKGKDAARIYWREAHDIFAQIGVSEAAAVDVRLYSLSGSAS
jgi:DNA-binding SARP family transcriptional activator